jgi:FAD/FMN-containing dehydrogenase
MNTQTLTALAGRIAGQLISPDDGAFDEARQVWNGMIDKRPGLIVRPANVDDVIAAVNFARDEGMSISVRGGGHHAAGSALNNGGLVIDLSQLRAVTYDAATQTARAQGGALLRNLDGATLPHGRTVPTGVFGDTGIAGLTLGGGYGWQCRLHGLTCDHLVEAEVVTSDGKLVRASESENPDLLWALRGGGQNLGVVTSFEYRTQPITTDEIWLNFVAYPLAEAKQVLARLRDFSATAPRELGIIAVIWTFPAGEPFPESIWNQQFVGIAGPYIGPAEDGQRASQPLRELGTVLFDGSAAMPFAAVQTFFDEEYPNGRRYYWRSSYLRELTDEALDKVIDLGGRRPSPLTSLDLWFLGGAIGDVGANDTPIAHRDAPFMAGIEANWDDPADDAANIAWAREAVTTLEPHSTGGSYVNFEDPDDPTRVAAVYGANFQRLEEIKRRYDPDNLFGSRRG